MSALAEQQRDAPQTCQADDGVDDPADNAAGAAEQPGNKVKLKNANKTPVQRADDGQDQCQSIHVITSIWLFGQL